ncbi:hypothetical protein PFISCL1PPCAC_26563 [Pristionchus fissidentatus]|uniref:PNPLA domain-containing protein n=1 Tax=Pristionchus fissidentatus TaxID=1538716 RepID=A0AAV5WSK4_9BILA|nr:hypothetical protein PFISCL1PPCAC_26563 [Pristionchus fissidentatus]
MSFTNGAPEKMNLSFSGCGFLCVYHAGVAAAIKEYAPHLARNKISGASAGSIVAAALICNVCISQATSTVLQVVTQARARIGGPLNPEFDLMGIVRQELVRVLPPDAFKMCHNKLYISLTRWSDRRNVVVSQYETNQDLIDAIICSCFIPLYCGLVPPSYRGTQYIDGGFTDNQPTIDEHSIMVSPFSGESDICPPDWDSSSFLGVDFCRTSIRFTTRNLFRLTACLMPPSLEDCSKMCLQGFEDALRFLTRNGMAPCIRCLTIQKTEDESERESAYASPAEQRAFSPAMRSRTRSSSNLQNVPNRRRVESECDTCCESEHMYNTMIADVFPSMIRKKFEEAAHQDTSLLNYILSFRVVKLTRTALGLTKLPVDMMLMIAKSLSQWMAQVVIPMWLRDRLMKVVNFIYDEFENQKSAYSARFACQLSLTEEMNHNRSRNKLLDKIELSEEAKREKALLRARDKGARKSKSVSPPVRVEREWSHLLPGENMDSSDHVVEYMRSHDAMYEFHFKDEHNKVHTFGLFNMQNPDKRHSCHAPVSPLKNHEDGKPSPVGAKRLMRPVSMVVEEDEDAHHKKESVECEEKAVRHTRDACCSPVREVDFLSVPPPTASGRSGPPSTSHREKETVKAESTTPAAAHGRKAATRSTLAPPSRRPHAAHVGRKSSSARDAPVKAVKSSDSEDDLGEQFFVPKPRERTASMEYDGEPEQSDTDQASGIDR